jgi:hypothetical protein
MRLLLTYEAAIVPAARGHHSAISAALGIVLEPRLFGPAVE